MLQRWLSFWKVLPSPQRNCGALSEWPSGSWSPPWPRPFSTRLLSFGRRPALGRFQTSKVLVVSNFFHLRIMEATVFFGTSNAAGFFFFFFYHSPDLCLDAILSLRSTDNYFDFMAWFLLWHKLSTVGPYIDRYVPSQIMCSQLNLAQMDSNQVAETSQGW